MRLEINAGGLDSFFNGVSSFVRAGVSAANSNRLIDSLQTVIGKTNGVSGGVGSLGTALGYIRTRKTVEETRKTAIQTVKSKTDGFIQTAIRIDTEVAGMVSNSQEAFYQTNPWLRPPAPPSSWDRFWGGVADTAKKCWDGIVKWCSSNVGRIVLGVVAVVGAIAIVVAVISTGGLALVPLLTAWGLSAGLATGISITVGTLAVASTAVAFIPNALDLAAAIDEVIDPSSNKISDINNKLHSMSWYNSTQNVANIGSFIFGGAYSIGSMYNAAKGVNAAELKTFKNQKFSTQQIKDAVRQDSTIKHTLKSIGKNGGDDILTNNQKGNLGEMMTDKQMRIDGYKRISGKTVTDLNKPLGKGIDGVYSKNGKYIIGEAKYTSSSKPTTSLLNSKNKQMSHPWIIRRLDKAVGKNLAIDIVIDGYERVLSRIQSGIPPKISLEVMK